MILSVDSMDSCGQLRKLADALYRILRFTAPLRDWPLLLVVSLRTATGRILASSYSHHQFNATTKRATGTIAFSSMESTPTLHFGLDSLRG
jgi:hypothetical protein